MHPAVGFIRWRKWRARGWSAQTVVGQKPTTGVSSPQSGLDTTSRRIHPDGTHYLIETKGREGVDVANKDLAASLWCENATKLTGTVWSYIKVPQKEFEKLQPDEFGDLLLFVLQFE